MAKVVKIKQKPSIDNADIGTLFEEMMGVKDADPEIVRPKVVRCKSILQHIYKTLNQFSHFTVLQNDFPELKQAMEEIDVFAENLRRTLHVDPHNEPDENDYIPLSKAELNSLYKKIKEADIVRQLIVLGGTLKRHSQYIDDIKNLRDGFIAQEPGLSFQVFSFSSLDLKLLWVNSNITPVVKKYVLNVLHLLWKDCYALYETVTSPDVDIDKFTSMLVDNIAKLKSQPGLHRCKRAFFRIEQSLELLKNRFSDYYRDSIASNNPSIMFENFIMDVSQQGESSASLTREFRMIIQHLHKISQQNGRANDPHVKKIFDMINGNFNAMDSKTE